MEYQKYSLNRISENGVSEVVQLMSSFAGRNNTIKLSKKYGNKRAM